MKSVFLIDDDADDREIFGEALNGLGCHTRLEQAVDGSDAFEQLVAPDFLKPDVIFLDLNMPKMDGREFLVAIKNKPEFMDIPVIIYSTSSNPDDMGFALQNQAAQFITKYHSIFELRQQLETTLESLDCS